MEDRCICCGDTIPEGWGVCPICEAFPPTESRELEEAKKMLEEQYARARNLKYVRNPIAFALYHTWKKFDAKKRKSVEKHI